jgi:RNA polymerase sigma-70 factor (ECF subfamily)
VDETTERRPDLDTLYRELHPTLLRHLRLAHAWQAEDLAADVWLEVASLLPRFVGGDAAFRTWLFTLARRRLIDSYRRAGRRPTEALDGDVYEATTDQPDVTAIERLSTEATIARLHRLLTADQVEVLLLRVVAGLPVDEVATITGKRPVNVRVLQHRALRRVADRMGGDLRSA